MLKQIIIGGIVGGFTLFLWGFISWAVMDWHHATVRQDAGVEAVVENISDHLSETGVYYFPPMLFDMKDPANEEKVEAWMEKRRTQPHGMVFYVATPGEPMPPSRLVRGFLVDVVASMMATILLVMALPSLSCYWCRVVFVVSLGVFAIISVHLVNHVFHDMPPSWTTGEGLDLAASWLLVGLVLGGIIKQKDE